MTGETTERGTLPDGTPYRIWRRSDGQRFGFVTIGSRERRRSLNWLRKQLREAP